MKSTTLARVDREILSRSREIMPELTANDIFKVGFKVISLDKKLGEMLFAKKKR